MLRDTDRLAAPSFGALLGRLAALPLDALAAALAGLRARRLAARTARELSELADWQLHDIGLSRADVARMAGAAGRHSRP